jgi:2-polyprenyl-3-methyl-5-hydroxy-6-metoxy-1,4-benzoquinol methylase
LDQEFRHIPKACAGSRLLDIGAGNGEFLTFASAIGWEVIGVEPDAAAADLARSRGLEMHTDTLDTLPVDQGPFDQVTLMQVVEHVHDPFSLLCHIRARLKPGGRLWLETSNAGSLILHAYGSDWRGLELHDTYSSQPGLPRKTCSFQRAM